MNAGRGRGSEQRTAGREAGFSLVEMAVVIVVLSILVAIAIPTFLSARGRASDSAAKSRARQGLVTQKTYFSDKGIWGSASDIQPVEPSVEFSDLGAGPKVLGKVYIKVEGEVATLVSRSASGTCYWARESTVEGSSFATVPCDTDPKDTDFKTRW